jgi:hypothetical protein
MEECYECEYAKEQICQGGCIGFSASKRIEEEYPWGTTEEDILNSVLVLNENSTLKKYEIPEELFTVSLEKRVLEINANTKKLIDYLDGENTLREAINSYLNVSKSKTTEDPLESFLTNVMSEEMAPMIKSLIDKRILIPVKTKENEKNFV